MKNLYSLTNPQKSIWLTEQFYKGSNVNNICGALTIKQPLDFEKFKQAINLFVKNNDSFRICLTLDNNEVKQYIKDFSYFLLSQFLDIFSNVSLAIILYILYQFLFLWQLLLLYFFYLL